MRHIEELGEQGGHRGGGRRVFGHGGLRLVLLQLIADKPRHGYELIQEISDRLGGSYSPSPGVIYPTLTLLEELGYTRRASTLTTTSVTRPAMTPSENGGGRKLYSITEAGLGHLTESRAATDALLGRMQAAGNAQPSRPPQVVRALENFKLAMRLRLSAPLSGEQAHAVAQVLDQAAQNIERI